MQKIKKRYYFLFFLTFLFLMHIISLQSFGTKYIAHALGGYKKTAYTNTKEAFENSYRKGFRFFEVDLTITPDNKIIAFHSVGSDKFQKKLCKNLGISFMSYGNIPDYEKFKALQMVLKKTGERVTQVDIYDIIGWMKKHREIKFLFHFNEIDTIRYVNAYKEIAKIANYDSQILDRILVGTKKNPVEEIKEIKKLGYYKNVEFDLKKKSSRTGDFYDIKNVIKYLKENDVNAVSYSIKAINDTPDEIDELIKNGFWVFTFNVNDVDVAQSLLNRGVSMIGTDYINPTFLGIKTQRNKKKR